MNQIYYRFKELVESWLDFAKYEFGISSDDFRSSIIDLATTIYNAGYDDASSTLDMIDEKKIFN